MTVGGIIVAVGVFVGIGEGVAVGLGGRVGSGVKAAMACWYWISAACHW